IQFTITQLVLERISAGQGNGSSAKQRVLRLQSRHQLFPQVFRYVSEYVTTKVDWQGCNACELGLQKYVERLVERLATAIEPDEAEGEPPLLPVLNRYKPTGTTAEVNFTTKR